MCVNKKWITNKITGQRVLIRCGKCEACQQQKASARTTRIKMQTKFNVPPGTSTLFLTLTYENRYVPFILNNEYHEFIDMKRNVLPVYRLENPHDLHKKQGKRRIRNKSDMIIDSFEDYDLPSPDYLDTKANTFVRNLRLKYYREELKDLPLLRKAYFHPNGERYYKYLDNRVGVIYYKDVQNFIKRLRIILDRNYGVKDKFSFFSCSEYGPSSNRPHHHLLLHIPSRQIAKFKCAIVKAWKFDNLGERSKFKKQIKLAEDAANYVSSYVNCASDFPIFFKEFRPFRPQHNYSNGYGMVSHFCKLPKVLQMAKECRFLYLRPVTILGQKSLIDVPLPSYVINRYFPKYKGFSRLVSYEIQRIINDPKRLFEYAKTLDYTNEDCRRISVSIRNHYLKYCELLNLPCNEYTLNSYSIDYVSTWNSYKAFIQLYAYETLKTDSDFIYHFTNWADNVLSHELVTSSLYIRKDMELSSRDFVSDPNNYPDNLLLNDYYNKLFHDYNKSRKIKNHIYMVNSNV